MSAHGRAAAHGWSTNLGKEERRIPGLILQRLNGNAEGLKAHQVPKCRSEVLQSRGCNQALSHSVDAPSTSSGTLQGCDLYSCQFVFDSLKYLVVGMVGENGNLKHPIYLINQTTATPISPPLRNVLLLHR